MPRLVPGLAYWLALGWCCLVFAQQDSPPKPDQADEKPASAETAPAVQEADPPLYYLEDDSGELQAVPGFTLEDFEALYKLKHRLEQPNQPLPYSLQSLSLEGEVREGRAELTARLQILVRQEHWVRVPLQLDNATVIGEAKYEGPGKHFLHCAADSGGYESWIQGSGGQKHVVTLKLLVPVEQSGVESRLSLQAPRATTSELKLRVPTPQATVTASGGGTVQSSPDPEGGGTAITVLGLRGDFALSWHGPRTKGSSLPVVLESVGTLLARIDGREVNSEVTLTVRSYGAPMERFRIRLPEGAALLSESVSGGGQISLVAAPQPEAGSERSDASPENGRETIVEVSLPSPTAGPVDVRLATRRSHLSADGGPWFALGGFEVIDAARQWGHIGVAVLGDWHVLWGPNRGVRQVDELPDPLRTEELAAGFEYFAQPYSLKARVVPRRTRVNVEPEYLLLFDTNQVKLEAKLRYVVRGAKVFSLDVEMPGWEIDDVGPENVVAIDGITLNEAGVLSVPLVQPSTGQIELRLRASQPVASDANKVSLRLPRPEANLVSPATVVVLPADNVELTPDPEGTVGLIRQQVAPTVELPQRQQPPIFYRGEHENAVFAAGRTLHEQRVTVEATATVDLGAERSLVEQRLNYEIAYEPLDKLKVSVPQALAKSKDIEYLVGQTPVKPFPVANSTQSSDASEPVVFQLPLPEATIGRCVLTVRYPLEPIRLFPDASIARQVLLVMPADGELTENRVLVYSDPAIEVGFRDKQWALVREPASESPEDDGLPLVAAGHTHELNLTAQVSDREVLGSIIVERAWIQTWLTGGARQDRVVFRLRTDQKNIELVMPVGVAMGEIDLRLEGARVSAQVTPENHVVIPLPSDGEDRTHLLELSYHFVDGRPPRGRFTLQSARLEGDNWIRRLYWQLILPPNEHLLSTPAGFSGEYRWHFDGASLGRRPVLNQAELETWVGAPRRSVSPVGSNCYLFGSLGSAEICSVRTASRSWIVLVASGAALVFGLLLIYVPVSRHPASLFVAGLALVVAAILYPEPTLLLSQAASLGLALALLAGFLERSVARRRRRVSMLEPSSSVLDKGSTQTQYDPPVAGNEASTQSVPAPMPLSTSDSRS